MPKLLHPLAALKKAKRQAESLTTKSGQKWQRGYDGKKDKKSTQKLLPARAQSNRSTQTVASLGSKKLRLPTLPLPPGVLKIWRILTWPVRNPWMRYTLIL